MGINEIIQILRNLKQQIKQTYRAEIIGVFGSFASGNQRPDSDIDVLVEFSDKADLMDYMRLSEYLEEVFGRKVDLVSKRAIKRTMKPHILSGLKSL